MKIAKTFLVLLLVAASPLWHAEQVEAQTEIGMEATATYQFGEQITLVAQIKSPMQVRQASIFIQDDAQGKPVAFDANGRAEYRMDTRQAVLRPFAFVRWHYQLTLIDGSAFRSEDFFIRYDDNRFDWQKLEADAIRVLWHQGDAAFGQSALNTVQAGLASVAELLPLNLSQPVDIYIYPAPSELPSNLSPGGEPWLAGHADPALGVAVVVIEPGSDQNITMERRIPHELTHVMLYRQIGAGYSSLPAWLREGLAVQAEIYPNAEYDRVLTDASAQDGLIPLKDLCASFSLNSDSAFLAYAESRSFTAYLRGRYGSDGLLNLAKVYADGVDCERGTERVFGVSLTKLEMDWRASTLGQDTLASTLQGMSPYLILLCLVILVPFLGILSTIRRKGKRNEPETYSR